MPISNTATTAIGSIIRLTDMPPAFIATSSYFSPKLPIVMIEANSTAIGNAIGTKVAEAYISSSAITPNSNPLPTKSSIYFHTNCISSTNTAMANVSNSGPRKDFSMSRSIFFNGRKLIHYSNYCINQPLNTLIKSLPLATTNNASSSPRPIFCITSSTFSFTGLRVIISHRVMTI